MISFYIDCVPPKTGKKNSHGAMVINGKARVFKRKAAVDVEATWLSLLAPHRPKEPLAGAICLSVAFYFAFTAEDLSTKARREILVDGVSICHTKRPDLSNLIEAIQDAMTTLGFWHDDSQVCELRLLKKKRKQTGVSITISQPEKVVLR